ncbi:MAG: hypothetical protein IKL24_03625 [Clostridia bacterium]|nr:hypothetical protein [Clostridia bacterium]
MKKLIALLLAALLVFSLTACFGANDEDEDKDEDEKIEEEENEDEDDKSDKENEEEDKNGEGEEAEKPTKPSKPSKPSEEEDENEDENEDVDNGADKCIYCEDVFTYNELTFVEELDGYLCDDCYSDYDEEESFDVTDKAYAKYENGIYVEVVMVTDLSKVYSFTQYAKISLEGATDDDVETLIRILGSQFEGLDFAEMTYETDDDYLYIEFTVSDLDDKDNIAKLKELGVFGLEDDGDRTKALYLDEMEEYLSESGFVPEHEFEMPEDEPEDEVYESGTSDFVMEGTGFTQTIRVSHEHNAISSMFLIFEFPMTDSFRASLESVGEDQVTDTLIASVFSSMPGLEHLYSLDFFSMDIEYGEDLMTIEISFSDLDVRENFQALMSVPLFNPTGADVSAFDHIPFDEIASSYESQGYERRDY